LRSPCSGHRRNPYHGYVRDNYQADHGYDGRARVDLTMNDGNIFLTPQTEN